MQQAETDKNEKMRESFYSYCKEHPEQRFFQALRNWSRENIDADINFILFAEMEFMLSSMNEDYEQAVKLTRDTWNLEDDELG